MAFYDDPQFIISHIRNSFITSDDTGMCEAVIVNEEAPYKSEHRAIPRVGRSGDSSGSSGESSGMEHAQSYDIVSDMDIDTHRRRSNTAQRLDRLKKDRQNQALIKRIQWREHSDLIIGEEFSNAFPKKEIDHNENVSTVVSMLADQLDNLPALPHNPFSEYAKFEGRTSVGISTKKINIYLTMLKANDRAYPLPVVVIASAKVQDLVGLICWQYTNERREPKLKTSIEYYELYIAEDDGEVDLDFPCLDPRELISKFGFTVLALVEKGSPSTQRRQLDSGTRNEEPTASHSRRRKFVKVNREADEVEDDWSTNGMAAMEAHRYQSFLVYILNRVRSKTSIHLGVSGEKIEIDPVQQKVSAKMIWSRSPKPVSYGVDSIASCDIIEIKHTGKSVFRLIHSSPGHDYKHHDFEAESSVANEIVQKINNILEMRTSSVRRDYLVFKERKAQQRKSFTLSNK